MSSIFRKFKKYSLSDWAKLYYEKGMCVIPLAPASKRPIVEWEEYQHRRPTPEEIEEWFNRKNNYNIAIVCGTVSGNLVVIDFDRDELYTKFKERLIKEDLNLYNKFSFTWIVKTKKGYHIYFRVDIPPEEFAKKIRSSVGGNQTIDIRGEGGYVVAPPSVHSEDKSFRYYFLEGMSPNDVPEPVKLTWGEWEKIYKIVKDLLTEVKTEESPAQQSIEQKKDGQNTPIQQTTKQKEKPITPPKKENEVVYSGNMKVLEDSEIIEIKELLKDAWKPGNRHDLALFLSGWGAKARIHPVSLAKAFVMLVNETQDDELEDRLSAIYYSYSKAFGEINELKELDKFVENLKVEGEIKRNVSKRTSEEIEPIKGKSGVQEILEKTVGEERALEIIRRLEEILGTASPYNDSVVILTDFDSGMGYVNDMRKLRIYRSRREENGNEKKIKLIKLVWEGAITRVIMYNNPLGGITKYEITWESKTRQKPITVSGNLEEIYDRLRIEGFLSNSRLGKDALGNIINAFIIRGKAEVKSDIDSPGFYIVDNKLINIKYEIGEVTTDELKEALLLLDELADKWYSHAKEKFATIIKWGIIAPFIYARKQLGRQYQVPHVVLYGARNTGKTTLAEIASIYLWETEGVDRIFNGNQSNTEARLGEKLRRTTFPIIINEANDVFRYTNPGLINLLKTSVEEKIARGKFTKYGYEEIPALAPIVFTLNPQPPVDFEGLMLVPKTILLIYFPEGERLSQEKIAEFRKNIEPQLPKLRAIGKFIAKVMLEKGAEGLKKDWRELSVELLSQAYTYAGLTPPDWLSLMYEQSSFEEIDKERRESVRTKIKKYSIELYTRNVMKIIDVRENGSEYPVEETMREMVETLLRRDLYPFIKQDGDDLYITRGIFDEIKLDVANLEDLANLLGWEYIRRKHFGDTTLSVVKVNRETFIQWLSK